jgi:prepilin signal peptidase PulO-like enzyme (type II secretory pathway)
MKSGDEKSTGWKPRIRHELVEYFTNFVFLSLIFGAFTWYRRLTLAEYHIAYAHYGIALIEALVLAKIIMIGDIFSLGRRLEDRPLVFPTLYKAFTFSLWVAVFGAGEHIVEGLLRGAGLTGGIQKLMSQGKYEISAKALLMFFAFIPFFAFREMERVLGEGTIRTLFFRRRESAESGLPGTRTPDEQANESTSRQAKEGERVSVRK